MNYYTDPPSKLLAPAPREQAARVVRVGHDRRHPGARIRLARVLRAHAAREEQRLAELVVVHRRCLVGAAVVAGGHGVDVHLHVGRAWLARVAQHELLREAARVASALPVRAVLIFRLHHHPAMRR